MHLRQRRHLHGIVGDEGRLDERALAELAEELVNQLALAHRLVNLHAFAQAELANLLLRLAVAVETRLLLDGVKDRQTAVGRLERYYLTVNLALRRAVDGDADGF